MTGTGCLVPDDGSCFFTQARTTKRSMRDEVRAPQSGDSSTQGALVRQRCATKASSFSASSYADSSRHHVYLPVYIIADRVLLVETSSGSSLLRGPHYLASPDFLTLADL